MAITKSQKEEQVSALNADVSKARMVVVTHYRGLNVSEIAELRSALKAESGTFKVMKNTLIKKAVKEIDVFKNVDEKLFEGPTAVAYTYEDEVTAPQIIAKFAKKHPAIKMVGGLSADGTVFSADEIIRLANLPSRQQLLGQVVGTVAAPLNGFVGVLHANLSGLVRTLNAITHTKS
jgi:large subunit ribosomal protein L10